jgi:hypothetical protein
MGNDDGAAVFVPEVRVDQVVKLFIETFEGPNVFAPHRLMES